MRAAPIALVLLALPALAGCFGGDDGAPPPTNESDGENVTTQTAVLPGGRGESAGIKETNKTEEGVGGRQHLHDYWQGREEAQVYSGEVAFFPTPLLPDGEGSSPKSVAYVKLPNGSLVYEGANKVTVTIATTSPAPPAVSLQYRSAADADWREPQALTWGEPLEIPVLPKETDMPHSTTSLWVFRLTTDRPDASALTLTIVAHKGSDVVDWPGHPDFYANGNARVVMDQTVTTHMPGVAESLLLYDQTGTWATPEKLISWGTTKLIVFLNVTKTTNAYGADPASYFLEVHNATVIGPEVPFGARYFDEAPVDAKHYVFEVPVDAYGMDGPYQPASRWGFRAMASYTDVGLCPGCFPYDIEYQIVVIAVHEEPKAEA